MYACNIPLSFPLLIFLFWLFLNSVITGEKRETIVGITETPTAVYIDGSSVSYVLRAVGEEVVSNASRNMTKLIPQKGTFASGTDEWRCLNCFKLNTTAETECLACRQCRDDQPGSRQNASNTSLVDAMTNMYCGSDNESGSREGDSDHNSHQSNDRSSGGGVWQCPQCTFMNTYSYQE